MRARLVRLLEATFCMNVAILLDPRMSVCLILLYVAMLYGLAFARVWRQTGRRQEELALAA